MSDSKQSAAPAIHLASVSKHFGAVAALSDISLSLAAGRFHALIGQNGAGKSTCLGILAGRIAASSGHIELFGERLTQALSPQTARKAGISTIYQELSIVPAMTALDNVFLCELVPGLRFVSEAELRSRYAALATRLGVTIPPDTIAGKLSIANQQMLEIMRALSGNCRVMLLDEPTAALAQRERDALFATLHELKSEGVTLVLVSHYLNEVEDHSDTVSVFRNGELVRSGSTRSWTRKSMVAAMLGEALLGFERSRIQDPAAARQSAVPAPEVLRVEGLSSRDGIRDVDLAVRAGEIVGIGGLVGSGRTSLLTALAGAADDLKGGMWIDGHRVLLPRNPAMAKRLGLSLVPEDRKSDGLFLAMGSRDNMLMGNGASVSRLGLIDSGRFSKSSSDLARKYDVPDRFLDRTTRELSGGNQQKLLLARAGSGSTRVLLADEATRGIDVGAKGTILKTLRQLADDGLAVIFVSSDLEEVVAISDRVYVMKDGRIAGHLDGGAPITEDRILSLAFGMENSAHG